MKKVTKAIAALMLAVTAMLAVGCTKSDEPGNGGGGTYNGHEYVDLGLPSGLLWATRNVGANSPEGYGDYFAWGETSPKSVYNWDTYIYDNSQTGLTKYTGSDGLTILQPGDDAATANWGSGARMPTKQEWEELENYCSSVWTTRNGVNGRVFTGSNGNTLFLPAAGYRWYDGLDGVGRSGYYWASSLCTDYPRNAFNFYCNSGGTGVGGGDRCSGLAVRAVREN